MRQAMGSGKKVIIGLALIALLSLSLMPGISLAQNLGYIPVYIQTPAQVSQWFRSEFRYETEMPDRWQPAEETVDVKKGDCEDFAILAQAVLKRLNIPSEILVINFKDLPNQAHSVCIFKNGEFYSLISNQELIQTHASAIEAAIEEQYPDWESITFTTAKREELKFVSRNQASPAARLELNTAGPQDK